MTKKCTHCNKVKSLSKYFKAARTPDKKAYKCKQCTVASRREWCKNNPEKYKAQLERRKKNPWYKNKDNMIPKIKKQRDNRRNLCHSYIIQLITSPGTVGQNLNSEDISDELIEAHKLNLKLKRLLKLTPKLKGEEDSP